MSNEGVPELQSIWDEARDSIEQGDYDKAIEIYRYILIRYSDYPTAVEYANAYLGDIFLTLRQLNDAEKHIKKAISLEPEKPSYHYILGFIYSIERRWNEAILEFEKAIEKEPANGEYLRGLGWAMYSSGDVAQGLTYLEKATHVMPSDANIMTDLAVAYLSSLNIDKAKEYADKAVQSDPTNAVAQDVLKKVLDFDKEFRHRDKAADKASTKPSTYTDTHFIYRFKVSLRDRPDIWRIIDIKGNQMLSSLHKAIFNAFDRFEEHQYSFFLSNKPYDRGSEYTSPDVDTDGMGKLASRIRIDSIELYGSRKFLYLFDYDPEWWHDVELVSVTERVTRAKYPRVVKKQGKITSTVPQGLKHKRFIFLGMHCTFHRFVQGLPSFPKLPQIMNGLYDD
jgi:tetratricopeptide (TPR) repeat protein